MLHRRKNIKFQIDFNFNIFISHRITYLSKNSWNFIDFTFSLVIFHIDGGWCPEVTVSACGPCGAGTGGAETVKQLCQCPPKANGGADCTLTPGFTGGIEAGVQIQTITRACTAPACPDLCKCTAGNCASKL